MLYSGVTGKISIDGTEIVHMSNFTVDISKAILEVISFGNSYKEKVASIKDWTGSADGTADFSVDGGQKMLIDAFESGAQIEAIFYLDEDTFMEGTALMESCSISHAADGKADISMSLSGTGGIVLTTPTP